MGHAKLAGGHTRGRSARRTPPTVSRRSLAPRAYDTHDTRAAPLSRSTRGVPTVGAVRHLTLAGVTHPPAAARRVGDSRPCQRSPLPGLELTCLRRWGFSRRQRAATHPLGRRSLAGAGFASLVMPTWKFMPPLRRLGGRVGQTRRRGPGGPWRKALAARHRRRTQARACPRLREEPWRLRRRRALTGSART